MLMALSLHDLGGGGAGCSTSEGLLKAVLSGKDVLRSIAARWFGCEEDQVSVKQRGDTKSMV